MRKPRSSNLALMWGRYAGFLGQTSKIVDRSRPNIRRFHVTPQRPFVDHCQVQTHALISSLHDITGLPWAASIPLAAVVFGGIVMFPIDYSLRKQLQAQRLLVPQLEKARQFVIQEISKPKYNDLNAQEKDKLLARSMRRNRRLIYHKHGLWRSMLLLLPLRFPIWLATMECLRCMTGVDEGLFGLIGKSLTGGQATASGMSNTNIIPIEHSFAVEGMLWFPNLLLPDTALLLPFILSATLFAIGSVSFITASSVQENAASPKIRSLTVGIRRSRVTKTLALVAGPATLKFPSAMLLYWICSSISGLCSKYFAGRLLPIANPAAPARSAPSFKKQQFRGPTMEELRNQQKKQKKR